MGINTKLIQNKSEQIRKTVAKEIFKECIDEIDKEIEIAKSFINIKFNPHVNIIYQSYIDGMVTAENIITGIMEKERYS